MTIDAYSLATIVAVCTAGGMILGSVCTVVALLKVATMAGRFQKEKVAAAADDPAMKALREVIQAHRSTPGNG